MQEATLRTWLEGKRDGQETIKVHTTAPLSFMKRGGETQQVPMEGKVTHVGDDFIKLQGRQSDLELIIPIAAIVAVRAQK